jgi:integrase
MWHQHKWPKTVSLTTARELSAEKIVEFNAIVEAARQRLQTAEGMTEVLRGSGERLRAMRARMLAAQEQLSGMDDGIQRVRDEAEFYRMSARLGIAVEVPNAKGPVDIDMMIDAWIAERKAADNPPKTDAVASMRSMLERMLRETKRPHFGIVTSDDLKDYRGKIVKTIGKGARHHLIAIKSAFRIAAKNNLIATNPALGLAGLPKTADNKRPPFTDDEAKKILEAAREADPVNRWSHWLATFTTGMNSEILQAHSSEFYQTPAGQWAWDMRARKLKTEARPRIVPLHHSIIREGFLGYLATRKGKPLFDGSYGTNKRKVNDFIHDLGYDKTFYSWRKMSVHRISKLAGESLAHYIAGHAAKDIHEAFYRFHELPEEFGDIVKAVNGLKDPTA